MHCIFNSMVSMHKQKAGMMQCSAVQGRAGQVSAAQHSAVQRSAVQCNASLGNCLARFTGFRQKESKANNSLLLTLLSNIRRLTLNFPKLYTSG